ncbi:MAG: ECF-type sigma factor [Acidobacteriota bacterium]
MSITPNPAPPSGEVTRLLAEWTGGRRRALDELMPLVLDQLRLLARHHLARSGPNPTLQPTALVHEAYLRLVDQRFDGFTNRARFFALASRILRGVLVDHARSRTAEKRGGAVEMLPLDEVRDAERTIDLDSVLILDAALDRLEATHPRQARVVALRVFGGLTIAEIAHAVERSEPTVERDWALGRRRLARELAPA